MRRRIGDDVEEVLRKVCTRLGGLHGWTGPGKESVKERRTAKDGERCRVRPSTATAMGISVPPLKALTPRYHSV